MTPLAEDTLRGTFSHNDPLQEPSVDHSKVILAFPNVSLCREHFKISGGFGEKVLKISEVAEKWASTAFHLSKNKHHSPKSFPQTNVNESQPLNSRVIPEGSRCHVIMAHLMSELQGDSGYWLVVEREALVMAVRGRQESTETHQSAALKHVHQGTWNTFPWQVPQILLRTLLWWQL